MSQSGFRQDMPPQGGYGDIPYKKAMQIPKFKGKTWVVKRFQPVNTQDECQETGEGLVVVMPFGCLFYSIDHKGIYYPIPIDRGPVK